MSNGTGMALYGPYRVENFKGVGMEITSKPNSLRNKVPIK